MKKRNLPYSILVLALSSHAQQPFTHVAPRATNSCNGDCIKVEVADLNNNPSAILQKCAVV